MNKDLKEYRTSLIQTIEKLNDNYDKLIITLSGGALALSLAFLKDIVKETPICEPVYLILAWCLFILSLTCVLGSLLFGIAAHRKAIKQVDVGTIYKEHPGGIYSRLTAVLHYIGTIFLIVGLIFITIFAYANLEVTNVKRQNASAPQNTAASTSTGTTSGTR